MCRLTATSAKCAWRHKERNQLLFLVAYNHNNIYYRQTTQAHPVCNALQRKNPIGHTKYILQFSRANRVFLECAHRAQIDSTRDNNINEQHTSRAYHLYTKALYTIPLQKKTVAYKCFAYMCVDDMYYKLYSPVNLTHMANHDTRALQACARRALFELYSSWWVTRRAKVGAFCVLLCECDVCCTRVLSGSARNRLTQVMVAVRSGKPSATDKNQPPQKRRQRRHARENISHTKPLPRIIQRSTQTKCARAA